MNYNNEYLALVVYVDDVLITEIDEKIEQIKEYIHTDFPIKDLGQADYFMEEKLEQTKDEI